MHEICETPRNSFNPRTALRKPGFVPESDLRLEIADLGRLGGPCLAYLLDWSNGEEQNPMEGSGVSVVAATANKPTASAATRDDYLTAVTQAACEVTVRFPIPIINIPIHRSNFSPSVRAMASGSRGYVMSAKPFLTFSAYLLYPLICLDVMSVSLSPDFFH